MTEEQEKPTSGLPALTTPMQMVAHALAGNATPETLERLLAMQERYERNQAEKAFEKAIASARGRIKPVFKNRSVAMGPGRPSYRHEDLAEIDRTVVSILSEYGLSYRFLTKTPDNQPDRIIVTCRIAHKDGWREESSLGGQPDTSGLKNPLQAIGSAVTYLKRITLKAALGLSSTEDEDDTDGGEPPELISEQQVTQLRERIKEVGQTEQRVCDFCKIKRLEDLPASMFDATIGKLKPKKDEKR